MDIGEKIKKNRLEKGLSQEELSDISNVSRVAIGNYERGDRQPNIEILRKIAKALDVNLNQLINEEDDDLNIGEYIRELRKENNMSARELAEQIGCTPQAILQYERGERLPNIKILNKVTRILGLEVNKIIKGNEREENLNIGEIIKEARKKSKLSQQALGDKLNVSGAYIQQIECNKKNPSIKTLKRITKALDVEISSVFKSNITSLIDKNLGENIKNAREQKGINQKGFALMLNIPISTLANYENGHREPNIETLKRIAKTLKSTVANLIGEVNGYSQYNITEFTNEELIEELKRRLVE